MKNKLKKFYFRIRKIKKSDREWIRKFIIGQWGSEKVISRRKIYYPHKLLGFVAYKGNKYLGLVTYYISKNSLEIITMNTIIQRKGIGTVLLETVEKTARKLHRKKIRLITTNNNINALRFYQIKGFTIAAIHRNALKFSRKLKPEIPLIGNYGIPLRDEIELEKILR